MIKCYYNPHADDIWLELWGSSTKHPDSRFHFSDFKTTDFVRLECQVYQWILECASKLTWPHHAKELVAFAEELDKKIIEEELTWESLKKELSF